MTAKETQQLIEARKDIEYMQKDLTEIKNTLDELPAKLVQQLDERYASKQKVQEIEETVAPFTEWRKKIWVMLVGLIVLGAIEMALFISWAKDVVK